MLFPGEKNTWTLEQSLAIFMGPVATMPSQENLPGAHLTESSLTSAFPSKSGNNESSELQEIHPNLWVFQTELKVEKCLGLGFLASR